MPELSVVPNNGFLLLFILFILTFVFLNLYYWVIFYRLAIHKEKAEKINEQGVSVVICARDEYSRLKENLPLILEQNYSNYEVLVVNHASDDDSSFLLARMAEHYPQLKIIEIKENLNFFTGKKFPLSIGIKSAKNDIILLTDADCKPAGKNWISMMQQFCVDPAEIVLGYGSYEHKKGLLNKLIRFDTAIIAVQYLSCALAGIPYMGVGRNIEYRKSLFYQTKGFTSHYRIDSGDDDLFINSVANNKNTRIILDPESFTFSEPKTKFNDWILQKKRHLSTGRFYRVQHKVLLGSYALSQFLFYLFFVLLLVFNHAVPLVLTIFFVKLFCQMFVFGKCMVRLQEKKIWIYIPFFEIFFLLLNTWISVSNLFSKPNKWK